MRSFIAGSAFVGLVAALPQQINVAAVEALPTPSVLGPELAAKSTPAVTYNPTSAASAAAAAISTAPPSIEKRDATCAPQPGGAGPIPGSGSVDEYLKKDSILGQEAEQAGTPTGYVQSFKNLQAGSQQIYYLTYRTIDSGTYDVDTCAAFCDSEKFCNGFNIYYERDPSVDPSASCPNPPPITNVKCALFGYPVGAAAATNAGQWRGPEDANGEAFHVVIAGSNGYSKLAPVRPAPTVPGFSGPVSLPAAINAPPEADTYNGMKLYNDGPFDPSVCAAACQAQTKFDKEVLVDSEGNYRACNFFNAYVLLKNDVPQGTYCSFYTREWDPSYAVNTGYFWESDVYKVVSSFSYTLDPLDPGHI
ncbi:hypothetical protein BU23DRAFT_3723 [Bimuria novae-zelandiae CBS 107.79]|uniref:Apple domain-containing protein n=1 Tax=Bimuria novae-zelandiae CBS 107.79 TaxID=1447943 RepID=A0A6A5VZ69_9PLEO|nr:hypothetical protein BU23DRAFT_3723 [Bimuria novae-zelandiae CBS 107.79]